MFGVTKQRPFDTPISATMLLPDSANLVPRSPILLFGVKMGEVASVDISPGGVKVRFTLYEKARIPTDSTVVVESLSALSEPYIEFQAQELAGPYISDGQTITGKNVRTAQSIPDVARTMTTLLKQLDPKTFASLVGTFSDTLAGTENLMPQLAQASDLLAATLLSRQPKLRELMVNAQLPGAEVGAAGDDIGRAAPEWIRFGVEVQNVVRNLGDLLHARQPLSVYRDGYGLLPSLGKVNEFLDRIGPDLLKLYPAIGPLLTRVGDAVSPLDISALISQALNSVGTDGKLCLSITVK